MSDREAFEKWYMSRGWVDTFDPLMKHDHGAYIVTETCEAWSTWQAALQSGEPVARVIDDGTPEGATEWIPCCNRTRPLKAGDLLYAAPQPVVDVNQQLVADEYEKLEPALEALVSLCNNLNIGNYDEVIAAEAALERLYLAWRVALLSAGKETV